jgi:sugar lactone lactonase YvrE
MYEALQFAGYDVKLTIGEGGHDMRQGAAIMPEALKWLWRDYPKPVVAGVPPAIAEKGWDPRGQVYGILIPGKPWQQVGGTYRSVSSPTVDKDGNVYFCDAPENRIYKSDAEGKVTVFKENTGAAAAIRFGADGRLYTVAHSTDLALTAKGDLYVLDADGGIGIVGANGKRRVAYRGGDIRKPSAITLSPDQAMLDVGDAQSRFSWSFQIAADGTLINGEPFFRVDMPELATASGVSGAAVDSIGQVYWADAMGIQMCEQNGRCAAILSKPEPGGTLGGIAFGGKDMNWLYVAEGGKLYRRETKSKGVTAWAPVKPPNPPL